MFEPREHENVFLHILRWTARASSVMFGDSFSFLSQ